MRLIRQLRRKLDRKRSQQHSDPQPAITVVLLDNLASMRAEFDDVAGLELLDDLTRVYADGPQTGIYFAVTADRPNTVPGAWIGVTTQKWLFHLADEYDYISSGLTRKDIPQATPGRAVIATSALQIQLAKPTPSLAAATASIANRHPTTQPLATPIGVLPSEIALPSLNATPQLTSEPARIPIGIRESDLDVAELVLYDGEHAIVAGPARSGKSLTLWTVAESLRSSASHDQLHIAATANRRSPLRHCPALDRFTDGEGEATALFAQLRTVKGRVFVLIDDAENFDDLDGAIATLLSAGRRDLHVIAAARADSLRSLYGHWTQTVRRSRTGLLLRPNIDLDGDLLGANLPRRAPVQMVVGRGYLAQNGEVDIVQVALPVAATAAVT